MLVWRGCERLSGQHKSSSDLPLTFPFKKLMESCVLFNCSMILTVTLLSLLPAVGARETGVSVFPLSFQSTLCNNLLSGNNLCSTASHKSGGDDLSSIESPPVDLDAVESGTDS